MHRILWREKVQGGKVIFIGVLAVTLLAYLLIVWEDKLNDRP